VLVEEGGAAGEFLGSVVFEKAPDDGALGERDLATGYAGRGGGAGLRKHPDGRCGDRAQSQDLHRLAAGQRHHLTKTTLPQRAGRPR
jgi:hypothetical protein